MANIGKVTIDVTVNKDKLIERLPKILFEIEQLYDLVPDWNKMEADEIASNLFNEINDLIEVKR